MQEMNDFYVSPSCSTKIHINGYVFSVAELYNIAVTKLSDDELEKFRKKEA